MHTHTRAPHLHLILHAQHPHLADPLPLSPTLRLFCPLVLFAQALLFLGSLVLLAFDTLTLTLLLCFSIARYLALYSLLRLFDQRGREAKSNYTCACVDGVCVCVCIVYVHGYNVYIVCVGIYVCVCVLCICM